MTSSLSHKHNHNKDSHPEIIVCLLDILESNNQHILWSLTFVS